MNKFAKCSVCGCEFEVVYSLSCHQELNECSKTLCNKCLFDEFAKGKKFKAISSSSKPKKWKKPRMKL